MPTDRTRESVPTMKSLPKQTPIKGTRQIPLIRSCFKSWRNFESSIWSSKETTLFYREICVYNSRSSEFTAPPSYYYWKQPQFSFSVQTDISVVQKSIKFLKIHNKSWDNYFSNAY